MKIFPLTISYKSTTTSQASSSSDIIFSLTSSEWYNFRWNTINSQTKIIWFYQILMIIHILLISLLPLLLILILLLLTSTHFQLAGTQDVYDLQYVKYKLLNYHRKDVNPLAKHMKQNDGVYQGKQISSSFVVHFFFLFNLN